MLEHGGEAVRSGLNAAAIGHRNSAARGGKEIGMWRDFCCRSTPICNCFCWSAQFNSHRTSSPADRGQGQRYWCRWWRRRQ
ncbi:hypothetical protein V6N11_042861 [Hibiscus sabdariffa]|uniref:Uncharacterized protein n=1 Tax=Hibiscus sabdariffa TaxID=183260 RepID=A0ABR2QXK1_9ROSI